MNQEAIKKLKEELKKQKQNLLQLADKESELQKLLKIRLKIVPDQANEVIQSLIKLRQEALGVLQSFIENQKSLDKRQAETLQQEEIVVAEENEEVLEQERKQEQEQEKEWVQGVKKVGEVSQGVVFLQEFQKGTEELESKLRGGESKSGDHKREHAEKEKDASKSGEEKYSKSDNEAQVSSSVSSGSAKQQTKTGREDGVTLTSLRDTLKELGVGGGQSEHGAAKKKEESSEDAKTKKAGTKFGGETPGFGGEDWPPNPFKQEPPKLTKS